jgi:molybdate transport system ATP-binding protein
MSDLRIRLKHRFSFAFDLDCSFDMPPLPTVLFGPSGAGKSTILDAIAGVVRCEQQAISFRSSVWADNSTHLSPQQRRIGYVMQRPLLFRNMTVAENISYGAPDGSRVEELAESVGAAQFLRSKPSKLSGGEQQRVALARALATSPQLLLLDEPFSALDLDAKSQLLAFVSDWVRDHNAALLYVTHDIAECWPIAAHAIKIESGRVVAQGATAQVLHNDRSRVLDRLSS